MKHCQTKFNFYLTYSVRIDIYDKLKLEYRPNFFSTCSSYFLCSHNLTYDLSTMTIVNCPVDLQCVFHQCMTYVDVIQDGMENIVSLCITAHVHRMNSVLELKLMVDRFVFVHWIDGFLVIIFEILFVNHCPV